MQRFVVVLALIAAACGKDAVAPAVVPELSIVSGDSQRDTVGRVLPVELTAKLVDRQSGAPLPGRVLNWLVVAGGGAIFAPQTQTASDGTARQSWTLGPTAGPQKIVARWLNPETGEPVTLDTAYATAMPARAARFLATFGPNPNPAGLNVLAVGDTGLIVYWVADIYGNTDAPCADGGPVDRIVWSSADSAALLPLGTAVVLSDGRHATQVLAQAARGAGILVRGIAPPTCTSLDSVSGASYLVR